MARVYGNHPGILCTILMRRSHQLKLPLLGHSRTLQKTFNLMPDLCCGQVWPFGSFGGFCSYAVLLECSFVEACPPSVAVVHGLPRPTGQPWIAAVFRAVDAI